MFGRRKSMADQARMKARKAADNVNFDALDDLFDDIEEMAINRLQALRDRLKTSAGHFAGTISAARRGTNGKWPATRLRAMFIVIPGRRSVWSRWWCWPYPA